MKPSPFWLLALSAILGALSAAPAAEPSRLPTPAELASALEKESSETLIASLVPFEDAETVGVEYRDVLRAALGRPESRARVLAALGLSATGQHDEAVIEEILRALDSPSPTYETGDDYVAYGGLVAQGTKALPILKSALRHDSRRVRWHALRAVAETGPAVRDALPDVIAADRRSDDGLTSLVAFARWRLDANDRAALDVLIPRLAIERERKPQGAADFLARMGPAAREAVPSLIAAMRAHRDSAVIDALDELSGHFPEEIVPALKAALDDPKLADRVAAALHRREGTPDYLLPHFARMMNAEGNPTIERHYLAEALHAYGPKAASAVPGLTRQLEDPSGQARLDAAQALGAIGAAAKPSLPRLRAALNDPDVASAAADAIARIEASARPDASQ